MARGKGFQSIVSFKKGTTWGTAVATGTGNGVYVREVAFPDGGLELIENMQLSGQATQLPPENGDLRVTGSVRADLPYESFDPILAQVFGTAGAPATVDTSARQHVFKLNNSMDGLFGTLAWEILKDTKVYECPSVKWTGLTVTGRPNENVQIEVRGIADTLTDASSTNTTTTIDTVTVVANSAQLASFSNVAFQMNAQTGGALSASDAYYISEFEVAIDRALEGVVTTRFGNKVDEPHETGFTKVSGRVTFAQLQDGTGGNSALIATQLAGTQQKAKLILTSANLAGAATQKYQHVLWFPRVLLEAADKPKITGPGIVSWSQSFQSFHVGTVPTGFTAGYTGACTWESFNQRATDALA